MNLATPCVGRGFFTFSRISRRLLRVSMLERYKRYTRYSIVLVSNLNSAVLFVGLPQQHNGNSVFIVPPLMILGTNVVPDAFGSLQVHHIDSAIVSPLVAIL